MASSRAVFSSYRQGGVQGAAGSWACQRNNFPAQHSAFVCQARGLTIPPNPKPCTPAGKAECKAALQRELGLPEDASIPLIGFIGRLDHQKARGAVALAFGMRSAQYSDLCNCACDPRASC